MTPTEIKEDIKTRLTGITSNIGVDKILPHQMANLPAIAIYIPNESGQSVDHEDPAFVNTMNVVVDIIVSQASNYSSDLDKYVQQVKERLFQSRTFIEQFEEIVGYDVQTTYDSEGESPTATAEVTIQIGTLERYTAV